MSLQPYQKASEEIRRQGEAPFTTIKKAGTLGLSLAGAGAAVKKILPFLNKYVPADMAVKGISKVNPRVGKFMKTAMDQGHSTSDVFSFLQGKLGMEDQATSMSRQQGGQESTKEGALQQFKEHQKKKSLPDELLEQVEGEYGKNKSVGFQEAFDTLKGGGITADFYKKGFESLKKGSTKLAGVMDPLLIAAKPFFDQGHIKNVEDLKRFAELYFQKKAQQTQQSQQPDQQSPGLNKLMDLLQQRAKK